jgi:uncharacterized protein
LFFNKEVNSKDCQIRITFTIHLYASVVLILILFCQNLTSETFLHKTQDIPMENRITFQAGPLNLEGQINPLSKTCGVVITHPHPLYGGELSNPVVESIALTYAHKGITTLRFNFRGVGRSEGIFENGIGEQHDTLAAIGLLKTGGIKDIHLVGYSFGAWVNGRIEHLPPEVTTLIMVSPPVAFMHYTNMPAQPLLKVVLTGSDDEIAPPDLIRRHLPFWNPIAQFEIIDDADHFFYGRFTQLEEVLAGYI